MGKKSRFYQRNVSDKGRKTSKRKADNAVQELRDTMPCPSTFGYDDMLPSQADVGTIVGWDCVSSDDDKIGPAVSLAEAAREFAEKCDPSENEHISDTPPLLKLWREDNKHTKRPATSLRSRSGRGRGRGGSHGLPLQPTKAETDALLARLKGHLDDIAADRKKKEDAEMLAQQEANDQEALNNQCADPPANAESSTEADSDGSEKLQEGHSFDLFTTQNEGSPLAVLVVKSDPVTPTSNHSTPDRRTFNQSTEELWTDEDDSLVVKATQDLFDSEGFVTPKSYKTLRRRSNSPYEGQNAGRHLIVTSSPLSTHGANSSVVSSGYSGGKTLSNSSSTTISGTLSVNNYKPQANTLNNPVCPRQSVVSSAPSVKGGGQFCGLSTATKGNPVCNGTVPGQYRPATLPFQRYSQQGSGSAGQTLGQNTNPGLGATGRRPVGHLAPTSHAKGIIQYGSASVSATGVRQGSISTGQSCIVSSKTKLQSSTFAGPVKTTYSAHSAGSTRKGVSSVTEAHTQQMLSRPTVIPKYALGVAPPVSKTASYTFKKPAAIPSKSPRRRSVQPSHHSPNLNDTSLSDDLLASLAEPDDMLDSVMVPEEDKEDFLSYLLRPPNDSPPPAATARGTERANDPFLDKENCTRTVTGRQPKPPVECEQQTDRASGGVTRNDNDMEVDMFSDDDGMLGESELLEFLNETECNDSKIHISPTWSGHTGSSWTRPTFTSKMQAPQLPKSTGTTVGKPTGTYPKFSTVATSKQPPHQPQSAGSTSTQPNWRLGTGGPTSAIVQPTPNIKSTGASGGLGGGQSLRPGQIGSVFTAQRGDLATDNKPERQPVSAAMSKPNSTTEQNKGITSLCATAKGSLPTVSVSSRPAHTAAPPVTRCAVRPPTPVYSSSGQAPNHTNMVSNGPRSSFVSTAGHTLIDNPPVSTKGVTQPTSNGHIFTTTRAGPGNLLNKPSTSPATQADNTGVWVINEQSSTKAGVPDVSQIHQQSVQVADSGCLIKSGAGKSNSQGSGNNSSSQGSGSQKIYTPEEIEKKRMEALKKKQNRLKLSKKPKTGLSLQTPNRQV